MQHPIGIDTRGPGLLVRRPSVVSLTLGTALLVLAACFAMAATAAAGGQDGLGGGAEYTRIPNGIARASSAGDDRPPANAFDLNWSTFWRNRTFQDGPQYLEMDFNGRTYTVRKIALTFGNHYPRDYRFRIKRNGVWSWGTAVVGNTRLARAHAWSTPLRYVQAVRIYCFRYSADDYFSVREMSIQR